jgi:hypothetical protein
MSTIAPERLNGVANTKFCSFDQHLPEAEAAMSGTAHLNDVSCYDLTWAASVVRRSWQNLREAFAAKGKVKLLEELKPFVAGGMTTAPNQEDVTPGKYRRAPRSPARRANCHSPHMDFPTAATISRFFARRSGTYRFRTGGSR